MARPKKIEGKAVIVSISCTAEEKQFLDLKGISPTQLFRQAINRLKLQTGETEYEVEKDIQLLRQYYVQGTRPNGNREYYLKAVNLFLEKHPDWTKAEVMARAERERHVKLENEKKGMGE